LRNDFQFFAKKCLQIVSEGQLIDFELNYPQKIVYDKVIEMRKKRRPVRIIILKARREGISTLVEGLLYHLDWYMHINRYTNIPSW